MYPFQNSQQQHVPLPPSQHQHYQIRYPSATMLPPNHVAAAAAAATMGQPPPFQPPPASGQPHPQQQQHMYQYHMAAPHPSTFPPHPSGMYFASPSSLQHPQTHQTSGGQNGIVGGHPSVPGANIHPNIKPSQRESVDKLVMQISNPKQQLTSELIYERRLFYERLILLNEQHGEVLSGPPQVSKSPVDLHSLYHAVKLRGGFEKTIRDKIWKNLCVDANSEMQQSSAAGFQLRKHYQKYLLKLECLETGQNIKELVEFAEKQKKKKKDKEINQTTATPIPTAGGPGTPSSSTSSSIAGKDEQMKGDQLQQQQRPSPFGSVANPYPQVPESNIATQNNQLTSSKDLKNGENTITEVCQMTPSTSNSQPQQRNTSQHFYRYWPPQQQWSSQYSLYPIPGHFDSNGFPSSESNYYAYSYPSLGYWTANNWGWNVRNWQIYQQQKQLQRTSISPSNSANNLKNGTGSKSNFQSSPTLASSPKSSKTSELNSSEANAWQTYHQQQNAARFKICHQRQQITALRYFSDASNSGYSFHPSPAQGDFGTPPAGGYPPPSQHFAPGNQYPSSSQWAAYHQQMYLQQRMRGPQPSPTNPSSVKQLQTEDEHQQQQQQLQQQGRIPSSASSSRLSSTSTPAPTDIQQNRTTSVTEYQQQQNESSKKVDGEIDGENVQKDPKTDFPYSASMQNLPNAIPSSSTGYYHHQIPHPSVYAPRYSPGSLTSSSDYPPQGVYVGAPRLPQQQQIWSPYGGMQNPAAVTVRYHHQQPPPPVGTPINRYPNGYSQQSTSQQNTPAGAVNSSQLLAASQQQQHSLAKHQTKGRIAIAAYPTNIPNVQQPQQFPAWFGSATMSTHQSSFVPYSLEAQAIAHVQHPQHQAQIQQQRYRRPKVYARDLQGVTPTRIIMALRSALHLETCWALNALNIQLYDDTTPNAYPSLSQTPEFLNLLVEHFAAVLSLLFPKHFDTKFIKCSSSSKVDNNSITTTTHSIKNANLNKVEPVSLMVRPPLLYQSPSTSFANIGNNNASSNPNFTLVSRLGRQVKLDIATEIPQELALQLEKAENNEIGENNLLEEQQNLETNNWRNAFVDRIRQSIKNHINSRLELSKFAPRFSSKGLIKDDKTEGEEKENLIKIEEREGIKKDFLKKEEIEETEEYNSLKIPFFFRKPLPFENWDRYNMDECSLISRQPVLCNQRSFTSSSSSAAITNELIDRCLALSNIFRGFSFLGEQKILAQHTGLLSLLAAILMLQCSDQSRKQTAGAPRQFSFPRPPPEETIKIESDQTKQPVRNIISTSIIPAEQDSQEKWLLEISNQLRDDAFTILAHISPQLDLYEMDSEISFSLFDALLHWSVCTDLSARDPLPPYGAVSPRHLVLETFCKMSVLERNIDLLLSTGPWPRIEEFVRQLCSLICEEPPVREFAIVILNALCAASETVCLVAVDETSLLDHLVSFLEAADANMTQIAQHQGIHALRENPEIIGTSVGMLRRTTLIMTHIVRHEQCRKHFQKLQHRLLQFTVSHFMDSRVAAMVADILFEMQRGNGSNEFNEEQTIITINKKSEKNTGDEIEKQKSSPTLLNGGSECINEGNVNNNDNNICSGSNSGYGQHSKYNSIGSSSTSSPSSTIFQQQHHSTSTSALLALYNGGNGGDTENCYSTEEPIIDKEIKSQQQQNGCDPSLYWFKNENNNNNNSNNTETTTTITPKKRGRKRPTNSPSDISSPKKNLNNKKQQINNNKRLLDNNNPVIENSSTDNNLAVK